jgi:hypothetical protein
LEEGLKKAGVRIDPGMGEIEAISPGRMAAIYQLIRRTRVLATTGDFFCRSANLRAFPWSM